MPASLREAVASGGVKDMHRIGPYVETYGLTDQGWYAPIGAEREQLLVGVFVGKLAVEVRVGAELLNKRHFEP